ncbi:MAG: hypothetical protein K2P14_10235 [Anaeroplasmataceae bacterium]|nr:hypothetical protein [Anaeroplasmataceae bacterium]
MLEGDITFEKIVEKTKRMLGKNYRGDKEMVPVHSELVPIEGHTDAFLAVSNGGFTDDEITLIKEKTKNYAWWVANHGYLVNENRQEIPALFIYGSEMGSVTPDVLNFNGLTANNFYLPIDRTDMTGVVNNSSNHVYVQFLLDEELQEFETDRNGNNNGIIEIDEVTYEFYAGRLYPEDKIVIDNNIVYPIYLISNLDYYYIPVVEQVPYKCSLTYNGVILNEGDHCASFYAEGYILKLTETVTYEKIDWGIIRTFSKEPVQLSLETVGGDIIKKSFGNNTNTYDYLKTLDNEYGNETFLRMVLYFIYTENGEEHTIYKDEIAIDVDKEVNAFENPDNESEQVEPDEPEVDPSTPENLGGAHNAELKERNNLEILEDVCEMVIHEAAQWTNRPVNARLMIDCWPVIVKCACIAYLNRGAEGLGSQSELGQQNVYNDWVTLMHKQITNRRYIL